MAGVGFRAVVTSLLFIIASLIPIMDSTSLDHNEPLFNSQNVTTEVRINDINSESNDTEALIWYPNTPSNERKRIAGKKKVNEFRDGFKILIYMVKSFFRFH